jgi:pyrimidine deaminase RibD-like protein/catechol 2,3-dioxygenase-like lactoylglutathione lyase family enzyme
MRLAIEEAELARGSTGDNPWVGCVIVSRQGELLGRGHTLGPGEDHAEIGAARDAQTRGWSVVGATLYSTLEPCSFHGRTPACSRSIAARGIARVVIGMRDPHPRVDGAGIVILRNAGVEVIEGICQPEVRRQLGPWVLEQHPHELFRRSQTLPEPERVARLAGIYGVDRSPIEALLTQHSNSELMKPNITLLTLGISDLERSVAFYRDGLGFATKGIIGTDIENGAVAFFTLESGLKLALWPRASLAADTGLPPQPPSALEFSIGHNVSSEQEVDAVMAQAARAGATIVKPAQKTLYGGYAGYFQDPDGHLWEVAFNPGFASLG